MFIDVRQTIEYGKYMKELGWKVIQTPETKVWVFIRKLPLLPFSVIKIFRPQILPSLKEIAYLKKKYKAIIIKIAPFENVGCNYYNSDCSFKVDNSPSIPTKTVWINLRRSEKRLFGDLDKKTRWAIKKVKNGKKSQKLNIKIVKGKKIDRKYLEVFYNIWVKNKPYVWYLKPRFNQLKCLIKAFSDESFFVFAYCLGKMIGGVLVLNSENMGFYWYGVSTEFGRKYFVPSLCLWEAIKEAKRKKLKIFDLEGIYDERLPNTFKTWKGFSRFKKSFGGKEIEFGLPFVETFIPF